MKVNRNLLLVAAVKVKNLRLHKYMWSVMGIAHETHNKFMDLVKKTDENGYNVLQLAVMYNKLEIIQWIWSKLDRDVFNEREMKNFFKIHAPDGKNILQLAAAYSASQEIHEWLWETANKSFGRDTLKEMVENVDRDERNVFHIAALFNTNAVFVKLYTLAKTHVGSVDMRKLLRKKELVYDGNVFDLAKHHSKDATIYPWLKTKKHKYF